MEGFPVFSAGSKDKVAVEGVLPDDGTQVTRNPAKGDLQELLVTRRKKRSIKIKDLGEKRVGKDLKGFIFDWEEVEETFVQEIEKDCSNEPTELKNYEKLDLYNLTN